MSTGTGTLVLEIIEAKLTRNTELFGKMDPYVVVKVPTRDFQFKTKVHDAGGKKPKWNESVEIPVKYVGDDMDITVYDLDVLSSDHVGSVSLKFSTFCAAGGIDDWFTLQYKGKPAGQIHLSGEWTPDYEVKDNAGQQQMGGMMGGMSQMQMMQQLQAQQ